MKMKESMTFQAVREPWWSDTHRGTWNDRARRTTCW